MTNTENLKEHLGQEFEKIYDSEKKAELNVDPFTDTVIVLSGPGLYDNNGSVITWVSAENIVRIGFAIDVIKRIVAQRLHKEEASNEDIRNSGLKLFLNGEGSNTNVMGNQLDDMVRIAKAYNFPDDNIEKLDCDIEGSANTKTQFDVINSDPRLSSAKHLTLISSDYHIPRVKRTADKNLDERFKFIVLAAPLAAYENYDVFEKLNGEIQRIVDYSIKGDISTYPTRTNL